MAAFFTQGLQGLMTLETFFYVLRTEKAIVRTCNERIMLEIVQTDFDLIAEVPPNKTD